MAKVNSVRKIKFSKPITISSKKIKFSSIHSKARKSSNGAKFIVSACLIGKNCFYDGSSRKDENIKTLLDNGLAVAVCPEQLGALSTPRPPSEIFAGDGDDVLKGKAFIFNKEGKEVTANFIKGAKEFLAIVKENNIKTAILKSNSPSCGKGNIYDGNFNNNLRKGNGVTAALLLKNNIEVMTEQEFSISKYAKKINEKKTRR